VAPRLYDVAVVGAGPGGSTCAWRLAKAGIKVALIDKASFPRQKACGGGLPERIFRHGELPEFRSALEASSNSLVFESCLTGDRAYAVVLIEEIHSVVGGSGAVVRPRKVTAAGTDAPGAAAGATVKELTAADIDLTTTIDTAQTPALSATGADLLLADGDKIGLNLGGTLTGLVGQLVITLEPR